MSKLAFVFPGQGAQVVGMCHDLYESSGEAKSVFEEADEALNFSLSSLCFKGPEDELRRTINTQPAIMTASIACLRALQSCNSSIQPVFVAGHSLGEYSALVAAGALSFTEGIRLIQERARLMQEAGDQYPGGMAAVIGLDLVSLEEVCQETGTQMANINSPEQVVISGTNQGLAWAMDLAKARGAKRVIRLSVSGAFHSQLMNSAAEGLVKAVSECTFLHSDVPVVTNVTAEPVSKAEDLKDGILKQVCDCVKWQPSVEYMINAGVSTFVEIGPGQVLTGLIKRINRNVDLINVNNCDSIAKMADQET